VKNSSPNISTLEDETIMLSQNVRNHSPIDAAPKPRRKGTSTVLLPKLKTQTKLRRACVESVVGCIVHLTFWRLI